MILSWQREGERRASFTVSGSPDFYAAEPSKFGAESKGGNPSLFLCRAGTTYFRHGGVSVFGSVKDCRVDSGIDLHFNDLDGEGEFSLLHLNTVGHL